MKRFCRVLIICIVITIFAHHGYAMDLEQMKKTLKKEVSKIGEKILKNQTVQDILLTSPGVKAAQFGWPGLLPIPLTKEEAEAQERLAIKIMQTVCKTQPGCFSWDLSMIDASKLKEGTPHQLVTPVRVEFTQTFDGLFTQSADAPGSRYGTHSGTLTDGTRVNVIGDSRPGNFTGSFNGQSVGEPGYTPATHNNSAFSGSSVGKISAIGFKEGDLKGTMTVTVPAGTQTATVTGDIKIKTDGSLSMPSYSGPVTVNATGAKVGAMSGEWNQCKTR